MEPSLGPLVAADETLHHQITDTFGAVGTGELGWTEKIWCSAVAHDGSLAVGFGLGKYANRGVLDAYGGVSLGSDQWTVRGSRALWPDHETAAVGPLRYEVVEPLRSVRVALAPNDAGPLAFDLVLDGVCPPAVEGREVLRDGVTHRVTNDVVRYHQAGTASGWIELDGRRTDVAADGWSSARDHSWGVRNTVGAPATDVARAPRPTEMPVSFTSWCPVCMRRPDGSAYVLFHYLMESNLPGQPAHKLSGGVEHPGGAVDAFAAARWADDTRFDDTNRRFLGGTIVFTMIDGAERPVRMTPFEAGTGFHLGTGLYFGFDGARHGQWRGELHVDGEHVARCDDADIARRVHQLRDCVVRVEDPVGGGTGVGILQTIAIGAFERYGLTAQSTFV